MFSNSSAVLRRRRDALFVDRNCWSCTVSVGLNLINGTWFAHSVWGVLDRSICYS